MFSISFRKHCKKKKERLLINFVFQNVNSFCLGHNYVKNFHQCCVSIELQKQGYSLWSMLPYVGQFLILVNRILDNVFNPLSPDVIIQILLTSLHTFLQYQLEEFDNQSTNPSDANLQIVLVSNSTSQENLTIMFQTSILPW